MTGTVSTWGTVQMLALLWCYTNVHIQETKRNIKKKRVVQGKNVSLPAFYIENNGVFPWCDMFDHPPSLLHFPFSPFSPCFQTNPHFSFPSLPIKLLFYEWQLRHYHHSADKLTRVDGSAALCTAAGNWIHTYNHLHICYFHNTWSFMRQRDTLNGTKGS